MTGSLYYSMLHGVHDVWQSTHISVSAKLMHSIYRMAAVFGYFVGKNNPISSNTKESISAVSEKHSCVHDHVASNQHSVVGVVIPVLASSEERCLQIIRAAKSVICEQKRVPNVLIVVDDASPECGVLWKQEIMEIAESRRVHLELVEMDKNCGPATARNKGMQIARDIGCDILCFMDSDCIANAEWIENMVIAQEKERGGIFGGITVALRDEWVGSYHDVSGTLNGRRLDDNSLLYACTCNMSLKLDLTQNLMFDETFPNAAYEDVDFCLRARELGITLKSLPNAVMMHDYDVSMGGLFREFKRYGRSENLLVNKHPYYLNWHASSSSIPSFRGQSRQTQRCIQKTLQLVRI
eukprot:196257_1